MLKHKKDQTVAVCYPYGHEVSARFSHSKDELLVFDAANRRRIIGRLSNSSGANITNARNEIVERALKLPNLDWLWWIDTDMVFPPDTLERLIETAHPEKRPIVGGLCFSLQNGNRARPTIYQIRADGRVGVQWDYPPNTLVEVDATGTGCLLVHRSVFEAMAGKHNAAFPWFMESALGDLPIGEDITFCLRARTLGFPIFVDTRVKVGHEKPFVVDEEMYRAQRAAKALEPPQEPTYAVIASRSRPDLLAELVRSLTAQGVECLVYDNGYDSCPVPFTEAHGWPLHRMWNDGLDQAEKMAQGEPHNVLIVNDDVLVDTDLASRLAWGMRSDDSIDIAYPDHHGKVEDNRVAQLSNPDMAGQTLSGWCFMVRGEAGLRFDEQFEWWYGDSDIEKQVRANGRHVVAVGGCHVEHLDPMRSTMENPERLAQAKADEARFAEKWGLDPATLWLASQFLGSFLVGETGPEL